MKRCCHEKYCSRMHPLQRHLHVDNLTVDEQICIQTCLLALCTEASDRSKIKWTIRHGQNIRKATHESTSSQQAFWQPIECPGQLGTRSWDQKTQSWLSHSHHWVCPQHAVPRRLFSCWCTQMNSLKTPLSGKLVSAQLLPPPPPTSTKTVD